MTTHDLGTNIGHKTAAIYRNMQHLLSDRLSSMEIKNGQYDFFYAISLAEGISQKELSNHLHIGKSTTAKAVKNLINIGYITKRKDDKDGRIDHLFLTTLGRQRAPMVERIFQDNIEVAVKGLTKAEIECVMEVMGRILNNLVEENGLASGKDQDFDQG